MKRERPHYLESFPGIAASAGGRDPKIAEKIVDQQSGKFDPSELVDRYEDAPRALIAEKRKGRVIKPTKPANGDSRPDGGTARQPQGRRRRPRAGETLRCVLDPPHRCLMVAARTAGLAPGRFVRMR